MNIDQLPEELERDCMDQVPPFGAPSVRLAQRLGVEATPLLLDCTASGQPVAFIALEALRRSDPQAFAQISSAARAHIYADELRRNTLFNSWGLPGHTLTDTASAVIGLGEDAIPALAPLLTDGRPAPLEGSEDATMSRVYGNRVCDYAWVLINEIRRSDYVYSETASDRDDSIGALRRSLASREASAP